MYREAHIAHALATTESVDTQSFGTRAASWTLGIHYWRMTDHRLHDIVMCKLPRGPVGNQLSVAQHNDAIGNALQLIESMRNVNDADAARFEPCDLLEQSTDFRPGEHGRGLIQDQQTRSALETARDLDQLLLTDAEIAHRLRWIDVGQPHALQMLACLCFHVSEANKSSARGKFSQRQIFGHAQRLDQTEFLQHDAYAGVLRLLATARCIGDTVELHLTRIGARQARKNLRQRALAGTVLTGECDHFPGSDLKIDCAQHRRGIGLADAADSQQRHSAHGVRPRSRISE